MNRLRLLEILLGEVIFYLLLWLWDDYLAVLISLVFGVISLLILVVALIAEWIERSGVPRWYYRLMVASIFAPLLAAVIYLFISGPPSWM